MWQKPTVLYVDDEDINLMLFNANLRRKCNVITALTGNEALQILKENKDIICVFSDLKMPEMNGLEFITQAKTINDSIPYYLLTGYTENELITDAIDSKLINKYFCKPIKMKEIEIVIFEQYPTEI